MFQVLIKKSNSALYGGVNPVAAVSILRTETKKHAAFSDQQLQAMVAHAKTNKDQHVVLLIQFMYYTLARPDEIRNWRSGILT